MKLFFSQRSHTLILHYPFQNFNVCFFITQVNLYLLLKVQLVYSKGNYTFDKICENLKYLKFLSALVSVGKKVKIYS